MRLVAVLLLTTLAVGCTSVGPSPTRFTTGVDEVSDDVGSRSTLGVGTVVDVPRAIEIHWHRSMHYLAKDVEALWTGIGRQPARLADGLEGSWKAIRDHGGRAPSAIGGVFE